MQVLNIAAYKFVELPDTEALRPILKQRADELGLRGTILLASEGINMFMAGDRSAVDAFMHFLRTDDQFQGRFSDIEVKESFTEHPPFRRMLVRLKKEIITMKQPMINPNTSERAPGVDPKDLKRWLDQGHDDDGREIVMLDTRNIYEVEAGTFAGAVDLAIDIFSEFPDAYQRTADDTKTDFNNKTVVTFCTGGIRCEKAALFLRESKLEKVYQLNGGILRYLEEIGNEHYDGECFVFDHRRAVDAELKPSKKTYTT